MTETVKRKSGRPKGPRPDLQIYPGILAVKRLAYVRMRAQAKFRDEDWQLTWAEFLTMWEGKWHMRGRDNRSLCMSREDWDGPWDNKNTIIITRLEHLRLQSFGRRGNKYKK